MTKTSQEIHTDFLNKTAQLLAQRGFFSVSPPTDTPFFGIWLRIENPVLYLILLQNEGTDSLLTAVQHMTERLAKQQQDFHCTRTVCLTIVTDDSLKDFALSQRISFESNIQYLWWHYSFAEQTLSTGKDQPKKLLGIEKILMQAAEGNNIADAALFTENPSKNKFQMPLATISIFGICAFLLADMLLTGQKTDWILRFGLSAEGIAKGEYYRFFTAMFLHGGLGHLVANSIYLFYFGIPMERILGTGKYLLLYLLSGLVGGLFSLIFSGYLAVGASGAIFGLLGASLLLTHKKGAAYTGMNYATMLLLSISALGMGMLDAGVDNFAHAGGFLAGLFIFCLFLRKKSG